MQALLELPGPINELSSLRLFYDRIKVGGLMAALHTSGLQSSAKVHTKVGIHLAYSKWVICAQDRVVVLVEFTCFH